MNSIMKGFSPGCFLQKKCTTNDNRKILNSISWVCVCLILFAAFLQCGLKCTGLRGLFTRWRRLTICGCSRAIVSISELFYCLSTSFAQSWEAFLQLRLKLLSVSKIYIILQQQK